MKQPEAKKATEKTPEGQKTNSQPKAATASMHESRILLPFGVSQKSDVMRVVADTTDDLTVCCQIA